jgi:hypothetical protein
MPTINNFLSILLKKRKKRFNRLRALLMSAVEDPKGFGKRFHFEDLNHPCYVTIDSNYHRCVQDSERM